MGYTGVYPVAHILIADDDPRTAEKLQALLASASHTTVVTRSGHEGIEHLKNNPFDLVITDLMMDQGPGSTSSSGPGRTLETCPCSSAPPMLDPKRSGPTSTASAAGL